MATHPFVTAKIEFVPNTALAIIHIPLRHKKLFLDPILSLLNPGGQAKPTLPEPYPHSFVQITINAYEYSVICPRVIAERTFLPAKLKMEADSIKEVMISDDDHLALIIEGLGYEASERIAELTAPLAQEDVPIYYISTNVCDYLLAPEKYKQNIIDCLAERGFKYNDFTQSFRWDIHHSPERGRSSQRSIDQYTDYPNSAPIDIPKRGQPYTYRPTHVMPAHSVRASKVTSDNTHPFAALRQKTFRMLEEHNITPYYDPELLIQQLPARSDFSNAELHVPDPLPAPRGQLLYYKVAAVFTTAPADPQPKFFSITLTRDDPASLWIEKSSIDNWLVCCPAAPTPVTHISLLHESTEVFIPLVLDLRKLGTQRVTGVVSGIVAVLLEAKVGGRDKALAFLSTAMAATVLVEESEFGTAVAALRRAMD